MDLFDYVREQNMEKESPLASRLRPTTLEEVVGQQHIIGKDKLLYRAIKADKISSVIFYGVKVTLRSGSSILSGRTSCCTEQLRQIRSVPLSSTDRRERARPPWRR